MMVTCNDLWICAMNALWIDCVSNDIMRKRKINFSFYQKRVRKILVGIAAVIRYTYFLQLIGVRLYSR